MTGVDVRCNRCKQPIAVLGDSFLYYGVRYCTPCFVLMFPSTEFSPSRPTLQSVITWIPVSERLPEKAGPMNTTYLCCDADNRSVSHCVWLSEIEKWHDGEHCIEPDEFTHWTEIGLPAPPAGEEDAVEAALDAEKASPFPEEKVQRMLAKLKGDIPLGQPPAGEEGEG